MTEGRGDEGTERRGDLLKGDGVTKGRRDVATWDLLVTERLRCFSHDAKN